MKRLVIWCLGLAIALGAVPATIAAQQVPGVDDPAFVAARAAWLAGDDRAALDQFARLSRAGSVPARILLSRIAATPHLAEPVTARMDRRARIDLLREPVGLSGRDWLVSAATENDLAAALLAATPMRDERGNLAAAARTLARNGEIRPALRVLHWLLARGDARPVADVVNAAPEAFGLPGRDLLGMALILLSQRGRSMPVPPAAAVSRDAAADYIATLRSAANRFAALGQYPLASGTLAVPATPEGRQALAAAARDLPALRPLAVHCQTTCAPGEQELCLAEGANALSAAGAFPWPFASPAQSLIPDADYWTAPRFPQDVARLLARGGWEGCR